MSEDKHPNRWDIDCKLIHTPCDNPQGCIGCYHQWQQDCHNYYNGVGPLPEEMERIRRANRKIQDS